MKASTPAQRWWDNYVKDNGGIISGGVTGIPWEDLWHSAREGVEYLFSTAQKQHEEDERRSKRKWQRENH